MARPKLYSADQPWPIRWTLCLYEFCASLKLAVVLISAVAAVLAVATFVESNTGTAGVQWYVYQSPMFLWLLALLAINVFCAAAIRYPWKRHQTGFVITHIGLLTLLAGSAVSYLKAVNSQMLVYEHQASDTAVDHDHGYLLLDGLPGRKEALRYPVKFGPFNWKDLEPSAPWRRAATLFGSDHYPAPWTHPPQLVYRDGDTKVEIVDYYSRSEVRRVPYLKFNFKQTAQGFEIPIEVEFDPQRECGEANFQGLGSVLMWRTSSAEQFRGFPECQPEQTVNGDGAVSLWYKGESHFFPISKLRASQAENQPIALNDGLSFELVTYAPSADIKRLVAEGKLSSQGTQPEMPAVELKFHRTTGEAESAESGGEKSDQQKSDKPPESDFQVIRFARFPFMPYRKGTPDDLVVEFYHPAIPGRVDILEGPGHELAFRAWQQKQGRVVAAGRLKVGEPVSTWSMGGGEAVWQMTLDRYIPEGDDGATYQVLSLPFLKDDPERGTTRRIKVRVSWQDHGEPKQKEFWLKQDLPSPWQPAEHVQVVKTPLPSGESINATFRVKETPVGFAMRLDSFDLQVDPGSGVASQYTSHVTISPQSASEVQSTSSKDKLKGGEEFTISPNAPLDYPDPHGRALRFFQENYIPPRDGAPLGSIFRVNYDPGRWIKYLGCLLVVSGIFTMFYMRAYFFKHVKKDPAPQRKAPVRELVGQKAAV